MTNDFKSRIEALHQEERVLAAGNMSETMNNLTSIYITSVEECTLCEDGSVGTDKDGVEAEASGNLFTDLLNGLISFVTGGVETTGNFASDILNTLSTFLGGEDSLVGGILSAIANFLDPGSAAVDPNPFITLILNVLGALNPLKADALSVVTADDTSNFEGAAFALVGTTIKTVTSLLSDIVTINVTDKNELAAFTIGALSLVEEIGIFGLGTVVDVTGSLLAAKENSTTFSADSLNATSVLFREMSQKKVTSMVDIYVAIEQDIEQDVSGTNATAILAISQEALKEFTPKINAFLVAADSAKLLTPSPSPLATFFTGLVTLVAESLNSIILLVTGLVSNVIESLTGLPLEVLTMIPQLISGILLGVLQIVNAVLTIFGLNVVPVSSDTLKALSITVAKLEGPLTLSELAACQAGLDTCPEGVTDEEVACQLTYLECINSS